MKLYYHKTDGGAEYLTDRFIPWSHDGKNGKEGGFEGQNGEWLFHQYQGREKKWKKKDTLTSVFLFSI